MKRYVIQDRDVSTTEWTVLDGHEYDRAGEALIVRDKFLADEPDHLPKGRTRVVDLDDGAIVEWGVKEVGRI